MIDDAQFTALLRHRNAGEKNADAILMQAMFPTFHALATSRLRLCTNSLLCPGDLVSEAYLRLRWVDVEWNGPAHFISMVARLMRNIVVDHERARYSEKRGGRAACVPFEALEDLADEADADEEFDRHLLHKKLGELRRFDVRQCRVAELKVIWGLTNDEIARELAISRTSVVRFWRAALAYFAPQREPDDARPRRPIRRDTPRLAEPEC